MSNILKKSIVSILSLSLCILLINPLSANASTNQINEQPEIVDIYTNENGMEITTFDDGVMVESDSTNNNFKIIIPAYQSEFDSKVLSDSGSSIQSRAWLATAWLAVKIAGGILSTCSIIEEYIWTGVNLCKIAGSYLVGKPSGDYIVSSQYVPGKIPGCQPSHSPGCNSGYYEYVFAKK